MACIAPYLPLDVPKPVAPEVWIVDGPEIRMRYLWLRVPFSTRMTLVRLPGGGLWVHSPIALNEALAARVEALGRPQVLVAPNTLHFAFVAEWMARWPDAQVFGPPGLKRRPGLPEILYRQVLGGEPPAAWGGVFEQIVVAGDVLTEVVFFHQPSRTLILTDLIENFEAERVCERWRWIMTLAGTADPHGKAPVDLQLSFLRDRDKVRAAAERMLAWAPERVLLAHGRPYLEDAVGELQRAFAWTGLGKDR